MHAATGGDSAGRSRAARPVESEVDVRKSVAIVAAVVVAVLAVVSARALASPVAWAGGGDGHDHGDAGLVAPAQVEPVTAGRAFREVGEPWR